MKPPGETPVVAFFVRVPVPGQVKTRLASVLGDQGACQLYQAMVTDILGTLNACALPIYLFHDGTENSVVPAAWRAASSRVIAQQGGNIGERMAAAFAYCFEANIERVILVGSDIPALEAEVIIEAVAALTSQDAVLAPVIDGGYCLIGLKAARYHRLIFTNIPWSTDQVLQKTLERLTQAKLSVTLLPTQQDIDTIEDLNAYCRQPCPHALATNRAIASLLNTMVPPRPTSYQRS